MAQKQITRNVALTPYLDKLVRTKVASGQYESASEVIRDALRLLELRDENQRDAIARIRSQIEVGVQELERGEVVDGPSVFEEIRHLSKERRKKLLRAR